MWMVINCKNGVSSYEISRDLGITQKSVWFILHRLREIMAEPETPKLSGEVEADETFVGGKVGNMRVRVASARLKPSAAGIEARPLS